MRRQVVILHRFYFVRGSYCSNIGVEGLVKGRKAGKGDSTILVDITPFIM